jgi:hypothetical protein
MYTSLPSFRGLRRGPTGNSDSALGKSFGFRANRPPYRLSPSPLNENDSGKSGAPPHFGKDNRPSPLSLGGYCMARHYAHRERGTYFVILRTKIRHTLPHITTYMLYVSWDSPSVCRILRQRPSFLAALSVH